MKILSKFIKIVVLSIVLNVFGLPFCIEKVDAHVIFPSTNNVSDNSITIVALNTVSFCPGDSIVIGFQANGDFNESNEFILELSDADGNFDNPFIIIGHLNEQGDSLYALIPEDLTEGENYQVRIRSTSPFIMSDLFEMQLTIKQTPIANFTYYQLDGYGAEFYNLSQFGETYLWTFSPNSTSGQENPTFYYSFDGYYPVTLQAINSCGTSSFNLDVEVRIVCFLPNNVSEIDGVILNLSVFPNPVKDVICVSYESISEKKFYLEIFNLSGQLVHGENFTSRGLINKEIQLDFLKSGSYIMKIRHDQGSLERVFLKY